MTSDLGRPSGHIRTLTRAECLDLLSTATVGRIAFVDEAGQQLIPVNFALIGETVYFRTLPGGFLSKLRGAHRTIAFGVDHHTDLVGEGWNVTVRGLLHHAEDRATINMVLSHRRLQPWAGGVRPLVMALPIDTLDGRRVWQQ